MRVVSILVCPRRLDRKAISPPVFYKIFSETMPERMGIYYFWVKVIPVCKCF